MAGGPFHKVPDPMTITGALLTDRVIPLSFEVPSPLPTGVAKLRLIMRCNASVGAAKIHPRWASVAIGADPATANLQSEGTQTVAWGAGDANKLKELKVILDAATVTAGELLIMTLTLEALNWTLSNSAELRASLIWE